MAHHFSVVLNGFHRNQSQSVTWLLEWTPFGSFESHGIQSWWGTKHEKTDRNHHHWTKGIPSVDHGQSWIPKVCRFGVNSTWLNYIYPRCPWDPSWSQCKCWTVGVLQELTTVDGVVSTWYGHGTWQIIQATNQYLSQHREYNQLHCFFPTIGAGEANNKPMGFWCSPFWIISSHLRMPNLCLIWFPELPRCSRWVCPKMNSMVDHHFHPWNMTIGVLSEKVILQKTTLYPTTENDRKAGKIGGSM